MPSSIGSMGTPFMFDDPVTKPEEGEVKAQPLATESTLKGMRDGLSIMQSDLLSLNHKLKKDGPLNESLGIIIDILENSAIARSSESPLEKSIDKLRESTVSFNEKTMRWHDDQSNLMVEGTDPRVAKEMKLKDKDTEKSGFDAIVNEHRKTRKLLGQAFFGKRKSAEDKLEGKITANKAAKEEKKQTGFLKGMWTRMRERAKKSWFAENWGKIAIFLGLLFTPIKILKDIWNILVKMWGNIIGKKATKEEIEEQRKIRDAIKEKGPDKGFFGFGKETPEEHAEELAKENRKLKAMESGALMGGLFGFGGMSDWMGLRNMVVGLAIGIGGLMLALGPLPAALILFGAGLLALTSPGGALALAGVGVAGVGLYKGLKKGGWLRTLLTLGTGAAIPTAARVAGTAAVAGMPAGLTSAAFGGTAVAAGGIGLKALLAGTVTAAGTAAILPIVVTTLASAGFGYAMSKWVIDPFVKKHTVKINKEKAADRKKDIENQQKFLKLGLRGNVTAGPSSAMDPGSASLAYRMNEAMKGKKGSLFGGWGKKALTWEEVQKEYAREISKEQEEVLAGKPVRNAFERSAEGRNIEKMEKKKKFLKLKLFDPATASGVDGHTIMKYKVWPPATAKDKAEGGRPGFSGAGSSASDDFAGYDDVDFPDDPEDVEDTRQINELKRLANVVHKAEGQPLGKVQGTFVHGKLVHEKGRNIKKLRADEMKRQFNAKRNIPRAAAITESETFEESPGRVKMTRISTGRKVGGEWVYKDQPMTKAQLSSLDMARMMDNKIPVTREEELGRAALTTVKVPPKDSFNVKIPTVGLPKQQSPDEQQGPAGSALKNFRAEYKAARGERWGDKKARKTQRSYINFAKQLLKLSESELEKTIELLKPREMTAMQVFTRQSKRKGGDFGVLGAQLEEAHSRFKGRVRPPGFEMGDPDEAPLPGFQKKQEKESAEDNLVWKLAPMGSKRETVDKLRLITDPTTRAKFIEEVKKDSKNRGKSALSWLSGRIKDLAKWLWGDKKDDKKIKDKKTKSVKDPFEKRASWTLTPDPEGGRPGFSGASSSASDDFAGFDDVDFPAGDESTLIKEAEKVKKQTTPKKKGWFASLFSKDEEDSPGEPTATKPQTNAEAYFAEMQKRTVQMNLRIIKKGPRGRQGERAYKKKVTNALDPRKPHAKALWKAMEPEDKKTFKRYDPTNFGMRPASKFIKSMREAMPGSSSLSYETTLSPSPFRPKDSPDDKSNLQNDLQKQKQTTPKKKGWFTSLFSKDEEEDDGFDGPDEQEFIYGSPKHRELKASVSQSTRDSFQKKMGKPKKHVGPVRGVLISNEMKDIWAEAKGIKQRGSKGRRAKRGMAAARILKHLKKGKHEEVRKVLGDELYEEMIKDSNIGGRTSNLGSIAKIGSDEIPLEFRAKDSPDDKSNLQNDLQRKNRELQDERSGGSTMINQTDAKSTTIHNGGSMNVSGASAHSSKQSVKESASWDF